MTRDGERYAEAALPYGRRRGRDALRRRSTNELAAGRASCAGACSSRARLAAVVRARCSATAARRCSRGGSGGSSARPSGSRAAASTSRSSTRRRRARPARARRSSACALRLASLDRARGEFIANASHELRTPLFSLGGVPRAARRARSSTTATRDEFLVAMREQVDAADEARDRPARPLAAGRRPAGRRAESRRPRSSSARCSRRSSGRAPRRAGTRSRWTSAGPRAGARRRGARAADRADPRRERARAHAGGHDGAALGARRGGAARALDGRRRRARDPGARRRSSVFERFYRLDGAVASGSGLGLAIARELAELMGGRIELESAPGGTRFTLVLRRRPPRPPAFAAKPLDSTVKPQLSRMPRATVATVSAPVRSVCCRSASSLPSSAAPPVLVVGKRGGLAGRRHDQTVVVRRRPHGTGRAGRGRRREAARRQRLRPAPDLRRRSPGVVTIFAEYGTGTSGSAAPRRAQASSSPRTATSSRTRT